MAKGSDVYAHQKDQLVYAHQRSENKGTELFAIICTQLAQGGFPTHQAACTV